MNVFILCTGRCGSMTFEKACLHINNFTTAHESRANKLGDERVNYPNYHIESDNRLLWFLPRLESQFIDKPVFYVHLKRNDEEVAQSYSKRFSKGLIMPAYSEGIILNGPSLTDEWKLSYARDYVRNANETINQFLKNKKNSIDIDIENLEEGFKLFWQRIGAQGDLDSALKELNQKYNYSGSGGKHEIKEPHFIVRGTHKFIRFLKLLPGTFKIA